MKITVVIHKTLQKFIPTKSHSIEAEDYYDILSFLKNHYPEFKTFLTRLKSSDTKNQDVCLIQNKKVIESKLLNLPIRREDTIYLVPIFFGAAPTYGAKSSTYYNDLKASFLYPLFGLSTATYEQMDLEGMGRRIADSSLFGRAESIYDVPFREDNDIFKGLKITNTANIPVPIVYGQTRVAGNNINTYIKNYRTNPDFFKLGDAISTQDNQALLPQEYVINGYVASGYVVN